MTAKPIATNAPEFLESIRHVVDLKLDELIPKESEAPTRIHEAIRWSVFAGGKRFRPALTLAVGQTFGARTESLLRTACAIELIHTYSLIHDDLPAMDDDDLRRGRATCHVKFGEATAILAGDALQALAFQTVSEDEGLPPALRVVLIAELARAAGTPQGMVAGQALDLAAESHDVTHEQLEAIHLRKTGALISAAARCGAMIGEVDESDLVAITQYSQSLGLLFQITDDLLDVTATAEDLGKTPGKDERSRKATYASVHGVTAARGKLIGIHRAAVLALDRVTVGTQLLESIADFVLRRSR